MENTTINGFTLKYKLGEGGMAEVWYAENSLGKPAAVKLLQKRLCSVSEIVSRFEMEAKLMVQLSHPHIRNIYDYSTIDECPCMVMEYLEGRDLAQRLKQGERFPNEQLITWWNDLVDALQYTHRKSIIHRDIKPSNLFVTESGQIKVLDFGIAKIRDNITVTQTGARMGTLMYMSPEQVYDIKNLDYKTDIYALAISFYHLVTGKAPYDSTKISDFEIQEKIVRKDVDVSALPSPWNSLLPGYLCKNAEDRKELRKIEEGMPLQDETIIFNPVPVAAETYAPQPVYYRRNRSAGLIYGLLTLAILAGLVVIALNREKVANLFGASKKQELQKVTTGKKPPPVVEKPAVEPVPDTTVTPGEGGVTDQVVTSVDIGEKENNIKAFISNYYQTRSDCNVLGRFFRDTVKQYYKKSNEPLTRIMKECQGYHNKWKFSEADINNETYVFTHNEDGNVYVDYNMLYKIKQNEGDDWIPYNIDVSMVLDADMKITRIVERRIEKL